MSQLSRSRYVQLTAPRFQAVWENDQNKVKSLTLGSWGQESKNQPLKIAVKDKNHVSPLFIACYRQNFQLARMICEIAHAQYQPPDRSGTYERYNLASEDSDSQSVSSDEVPVYKELIDENFTIENVAAVANTAKSDVTPLEMFGWSDCDESTFPGWVDEYSRKYKVNFPIPLQHLPLRSGVSFFSLYGELACSEWTPPFAQLPILEAVSPYPAPAPELQDRH